MKNKQLLAVIIARGGSKGIPKKNIFHINGRPLISWTIRAALQSKCISKLVVSSDDISILKVSQELGCKDVIKRPKILSGDDVPSSAVVLHALTLFPQYEYVLLLQPTSPLRTAEDIDQAFFSLLKSDSKSCVSVCPSSESPYWTYSISNDGVLVNIIEPPENGHRRQNLPATFVLNGAIYIAKTDFLISNKSFFGPDTQAFIMPKNKSIDIDSIEDIYNFSNSLQLIENE